MKKLFFLSLLTLMIGSYSFAQSHKVEASGSVSFSDSRTCVYTVDYEVRSKVSSGSRDYSIVTRLKSNNCALINIDYTIKFSCNCAGVQNTGKLYSRGPVDNWTVSSLLCMKSDVVPTNLELYEFEILDKTTHKFNKYNQRHKISFGAAESNILTDPRDGKKYKTVKIGNQTWMAENLNYSTIDSWCYNNSSSNCNTYGRLYTWLAARNACPPGWHLPSDSEWSQLENNLGGGDVAGGKLKSTSFWNSPNIGATNSSGFSAFPGGDRDTNGSFYGLGYYGYWWSSTGHFSRSAWGRGMYRGSGGVYRGNYIESIGFSVRCLRD